MDYFVREVQMCEGVQKTAGIKARDDMEEIFVGLGMKPINISTQKREKQNKLKEHWNTLKNWKIGFDKLNSGDRVFIQFPVIEHSIFLGNYLKNIVNKGVFIVLIIHDLEIIRWGKRKDASITKKIRYQIEETSALKYCNKIIAHNNFMKLFLNQLGIKENKIYTLQIFDYLIPEYDENRMRDRKIEKNLPVIIAGALRPHKVGYVYNLPENCEFNLYGVGYEGPVNDKIHYLGSFLPDEIPYVLNGSFGLVWDGESADTCKGAYGEYLKINNPHKTSLYLAAGLPVIIWKDAALAEFVREEECGILVGSLQDIGKQISELPEEEYRKLRQNAEKIGKKLRSGFYTKRILQKVIN